MSVTLNRIHTENTIVTAKQYTNKIAQILLMCDLSRENLEEDGIQQPK